MHGVEEGFPENRHCGKETRRKCEHSRIFAPQKLDCVFYAELRLSRIPCKTELRDLRYYGRHCQASPMKAKIAL